MRRSINTIMEEIFDILKINKEMSLRQLALKINSPWLTVRKALKSMKYLQLVKERIELVENRKTRFFSLK